MDIIIDTVGQADLATKDRLVESDDDDLEFEDADDTDVLNGFDLEKQFCEEELQMTKKKKDTAKDFNLRTFEIEMGWNNRLRRQPKEAANVKKMTQLVNPIDKVLAKSAIKPGFEQLEAAPPYSENEKKLRVKRRRERAKTSGESWFNMRAPEMTPEVKHDLEVLKMRSALDPKHFYKKNDHKNALPKHFHIGKIIDSPVDYYSSRLTKKERKKTIVDELMADAEFAKYNKRKYKQIIDEKQKTHYKAHRHAKRLKGKKGKKK